ncbi:arginyltransferase [Granulosicoccus sp. 3-233]|uniref:arginyltransferase n=1 Tax=Granulosicoccus sp. 3-233 TaxID=3417969 RepID=UPI003D3405E7
MIQQRIKLYQGSINPCSYLDDREAVNIYADPHHPNPRAVYNQLIKRGFRRSGEYVYRPGCTGCSACIPVRILCDEFRMRRTDRRNCKRNQDLKVDFREACYTDEYFQLYQRYLAARHPDGGMDDPDPEDFERFLLNPWGETLFVDIRLERQVIAVAVTDATADGLSAVYTFFDPEHADRGLGRFSIMQQIELCKAIKLPYLYLGYWVDGCQKMQYKTDFQPQEHFDGHQWQEVLTAERKAGE